MQRLDPEEGIVLLRGKVLGDGAQSHQLTLERTLKQLHATAQALSEAEALDATHQRQVNRRTWGLPSIDRPATAVGRLEMPDLG